MGYTETHCIPIFTVLICKHARRYLFEIRMSVIENEFIDACLCVRVCVCVCVYARARACVEREIAMPRVLQLLLFAATACTLLLPKPVLAIRCYTTSFDVRYIYIHVHIHIHIYRHICICIYYIFI